MPVFPIGALVWWPEPPPEGVWEDITLRVVRPLLVKPGQLELNFEEKEEDDLRLWRRVE